VCAVSQKGRENQVAGGGRGVAAVVCGVRAVVCVCRARQVDPDLPAALQHVGKGPGQTVEEFVEVLMRYGIEGQRSLPAQQPAPAQCRSSQPPPCQHAPSIRLPRLTLGCLLMRP